jgi:hypothetical protein
VLAQPLSKLGSAAEAARGGSPLAADELFDHWSAHHPAPVVVARAGEGGLSAMLAQKVLGAAGQQDLDALAEYHGVDGRLGARGAGRCGGCPSVLRTA